MPSDRIYAKACFVSWALFLAWSGFVFQGAVLPSNKIPLFLLHMNDKIVHGLSYLILFGTALFAFKNTRWIFLRVSPEKSALVYCAVMGIVTEISQIFVPGRVCDAADWTADVLGAVLGLFLYRRLIHKEKKHEIL